MLWRRHLWAPVHFRLSHYWRSQADCIGIWLASYISWLVHHQPQSWLKAGRTEPWPPKQLWAASEKLELVDNSPTFFPQGTNLRGGLKNSMKIQSSALCSCIFLWWQRPQPHNKLLYCVGTHARDQTSHKPCYWCYLQLCRPQCVSIHYYPFSKAPTQIPLYQNSLLEQWGYIRRHTITVMHKTGRFKAGVCI